MAATAEETPQQFEQRTRWWREARFGMFIHWGVYSVPAGEYKGQRFDHIGEGRYEATEAQIKKLLQELGEDVGGIASVRDPQPGPLSALQDQHGRALTHDKPIPSLVERPASSFRRIVPRRESLHGIKTPDPHRTDG